MNKVLILVGFSGMHLVVTKRFLADLFKPNEILTIENASAVLSMARTDPVTWIVYSVFALGLEIESLLARLIERYPESAHAYYSDFPVSDAVSLRCKMGGATYLIWDINTETEFARLASAIDKGIPFYPERIAGLGSEEEAQILEHSVSLTARQHQALRHDLLKMSIKESASELGVTEKTVSTHRARYAEKLKRERACGLLSAAVMNNLVSPHEVIRSLGSEGI